MVSLLIIGRDWRVGFAVEGTPCGGIMHAVGRRPGNQQQLMWAVPEGGDADVAGETVQQPVAALQCRQTDAMTFKCLLGFQYQNAASARQLDGKQKRAMALVLQQMTCTHIR